MNFGTILNSMTKKCILLVMEGNEKESKGLAKDFISYVNLKPVLRDQFKVYHNLNESYVNGMDSAQLFVTETINTLKKYSFEDIKIYNALLETKFNPKKTKSTDINYHIARLIKYTTSEDDLDVHSYVESLKTITEHVQIIKNDKKQLSEISNSELANSSLKFLEPKHVIKVAIKKFNKEYYSKLDENDRKIFNILRNNNKSKINELFNNQIKELDNLMDNIQKMDILDAELSNKVQESIEILSNECTSKNILNAYELLEELRSLNEKV